MFKLFFDGAVAPQNPGGHGGYGLAVFNDGRVVHTEFAYIGRWSELSNNVAEYAGAIAALRYLLQHNISEATIYGDANLIINQLSGRWGVKRGAYVPYFHEAYALKNRLPKVKLIWIPREQNAVADTLSKRAVTACPRVVGFKLDPSIVPIRPPKPQKKRKRTRDLLRLNLSLVNSDDEAWQQFIANVMES